MIRVGINGFGRIGRNIFRIPADREDIMVTAVYPANPQLNIHNTYSADFHEIELRTAPHMRGDRSCFHRTPNVARCAGVILK